MLKWASMSLTTRNKIIVAVLLLALTLAVARWVAAKQRQRVQHAAYLKTYEQYDHPTQDQWSKWTDDDWNKWRAYHNDRPRKDRP